MAAREKFGWWGTDLKSDVINPIFVYFLNIRTAIYIFVLTFDKSDNICD